MLQILGMVLKWTLAFYGFLAHVSATENSEFKSKIEWTALEYEDVCFKIANSTWEFLKNPTSQTLRLWVNFNILIFFTLL